MLTQVGALEDGRKEDAYQKKWSVERGKLEICQLVSDITKSLTTITLPN